MSGVLVAPSSCSKADPSGLYLAVLDFSLLLRPDPAPLRQTPGRVGLRVGRVHRALRQLLSSRSNRTRDGCHHVLQRPLYHNGLFSGRSACGNLRVTRSILGRRRLRTRRVFTLLHNARNILWVSVRSGLCADQARPSSALAHLGVRCLCSKDVYDLRGRFRIPPHLRRLYRRHENTARHLLDGEPILFVRCRPCIWNLDDLALRPEAMSHWVPSRLRDAHRRDLADPKRARPIGHADTQRHCAWNGLSRPPDRRPVRYPRKREGHHRGVLSVCLFGGNGSGPR